MKRYLRIDPIDTAGYERVEVIACFYKRASDKVPTAAVNLTAKDSTETNDGPCATGERVEWKERATC